MRRDPGGGTKLELGRIDQVGFVVPDLDATCARCGVLFELLESPRAR